MPVDNIGYFNMTKVVDKITTVIHIVGMQADRPLSPPASYRPEFAERGRKLCRVLGATDQEMARFFDVDPATLSAWLATVPAFADAIRAGREQADTEVKDSLRRRAVGYRHTAVKVFMPADALFPEHVAYPVHRPPVVAAGRYWLNNRQPDEWRDKVEVATTHDHDPDALSDEKLATIVARDRGSHDPAPQEDSQ